MTSSAVRPPMKPFEKHILVCTGEKCAPESSPALYQWLKNRLKELKLHEGSARIERSQCHCLGICEGGPIVVVYPEGVWYHHIDQEKLEEIIQKHLIKNQPVEPYILYRKDEKLLG